MTVSSQLREALRERISKGESIYRAAMDAGVAYAIVTRFLSEERTEIRATTIDKLAEYLGLELKPKGKK